MWSEGHPSNGIGLDEDACAVIVDRFGFSGTAVVLDERGERVSGVWTGFGQPEDFVYSWSDPVSNAL